MSKTLVYLGIGANLVPEGYDSLYQGLEDVVHHIKQEHEVIECSRWFVSAPVPISNQPDFMNMVLAIKTDLPAFDLLTCIHNLEAKFGRVRTKRNAARVLDIDVLGYGDDIIDSPHLTIPHPRLAERAFVLLPWLDIAPDWSHPVLGLTVAEMAKALGDGDEDLQICKPM